MAALDLWIFSVFLVVNLGIGLWYGREVKDLKAYALGNRNFSSNVIVATIVATWVSGSSFTNTIEKGNALGLVYLSLTLSMGLMFLLMSSFVVLRMGELLGALSIVEAMGNLWRPRVRKISALASIVSMLGIMTAQMAS